MPLFVCTRAIATAETRRPMRRSTSIFNVSAASLKAEESRSRLDSQQWTFDNPVVIFTILISVLLLLLFGFLFIGCYGTSLSSESLLIRPSLTFCSAKQKSLRQTQAKVLSKWRHLGQGTRTSTIVDLRKHGTEGQRALHVEVSDRRVSNLAK